MENVIVKDNKKQNLNNYYLLSLSILVIVALLLVVYLNKQRIYSFFKGNLFIESSLTSKELGEHNAIALPSVTMPSNEKAIISTEISAIPQSVNDTENEIDHRVFRAIYVEQYVEQLHNLQILINNFAHDIEYSKELVTLQNLPNMPKYITDILNDLIDYNNQYLAVDNEQAYEVIFPVKYNFLAKLMKVSHKTTIFTDKNKLREKITAKLNLLINYLYSEEMQYLLLNKRG